MSLLRLAATILLAATAGGCALFQPVVPNQAGRILDDKLNDPERVTTLAEMAERNKKLREQGNEEVTKVAARAGSGIVGEVNADKAISPKAKGGKANGAASPIRLDFVDASLQEVVVAFMNYLKQPYSFTDSFKDRKVNLFFDAKATREEVIQLFDTLLENYGVKLRYSGGVYYVGSAEDKGGPMQQPSPAGIGDSLGVFRLGFVDAREFQTLAKQVVRYPERLSVLPGNVVVVNSTGNDVRAVRSLSEDVDIPAFTGKFVLIYSPRYLPAASLIALMDSVLGPLSGATGQGGIKQVEAKQVPETERIVIVAANRSARDLVVQILGQSDIPGGNFRRVFQYVLGTQTAADIVPNLTTLVKSVIKSPAEVNVVPDKTSNSLFIYASPEEYVEIRKVLARMDFRPPAVYIDIAIAEVDLTNSMRYGVDWFLKNSGNWLTTADLRLGFDIGTTGGFAVGVISASNNFATLQLLGSETTFSLLSSPKLVVRNGATAKIQVGSEQPVIKTKSTAATAGISTIIEPEYKKVGLEMEVTPFVSSSNEVRLVIKVKDTAITGQVLLAGDRYPILANRELNTDLVTSDGRSIFLGGIRRQDANDTATTVPGLANLPYVGAAFRNKQMDSSGSELIILATATVILDQQGADLVTRALIKAAHQSMRDLRPPGYEAEMTAKAGWKTLWPPSSATVNQAPPMFPPAPETAAPAAATSATVPPAQANQPPATPVPASAAAVGRPAAGAPAAGTTNPSAVPSSTSASGQSSSKAAGSGGSASASKPEKPRATGTARQRDAASKTADPVQ